MAMNIILLTSELKLIKTVMALYSRSYFTFNRDVAFCCTGSHVVYIFLENQQIVVIDDAIH